MKSSTRLRAGSAAIAVTAAMIVAPWTAQNAQAVPFNYAHMTKIQKRLVSGALAWAVAPHHGLAPRARVNGSDEGDGPDGLPDTPPAGYGSAGSPAAPANYVARGGGECAANLHGNVKVNQNCLNLSDPDLQGRGQANNETSIAQNPFAPRQMVASNNDYRRGDGTCGASYSADSGRSWQDSTVPNEFTRGFAGHPREYWEAGGDTSVAWDTRGNAYLSCQVFNRGTSASNNPDFSSAFVVFRSTGNGGASWNFPGRYVSSNYDPAGNSGVLEDKQLLAVDNHVNSPFRDRVYVSWTEFAADGTGYIYEAYSKDYGQTFSPRVLVSATSPDCTNTYGIPTPNGNCNENQDSDPFVGPDGALYVAFNNYNNTPAGNDNRNQVLLAKSTDGGASFSAPVKVGDFYDLPDCYAYQGDDPGRACVPEKGSSTLSVFRASNYPSGAVNPRDPSEVSVTYGSYINRNSNESNGCVPAGFSQFGQNLYTGVKTPGACNNDILLSTSHNGGTSFSGTTTDPRQQTTINRSPAQGTTDQFWQSAGYSSRGTLAVTYYDRRYGNDEYNGSSDVSVSSSRDLVHFDSTRVTSDSMPAPTEFYGSKGGQFYGDYIGMAVGDYAAYPVWSDTRNLDLFLCPNSATGPGVPPQVCTATEPNGQTANDQDIYTATVPLSGHDGHHH